MNKVFGVCMQLFGVCCCWSGLPVLIYISRNGNDIHYFCHSNGVRVRRENGFYELGHRLVGRRERKGQEGLRLGGGEGRWPAYESIDCLGGHLN